MAALIAAFVLLAFAPQEARETPLHFDAPEGASDADRTKAAKALAARCGAAYGMAGVAGDTVRRSPNGPRQIRLVSPKGFTEEQAAAIDFLASFPCLTVQIRLEHFLTEAEKEKYGDRESAPKGRTWTRMKDWQFVEGPYPRYKVEDQEYELLFLDKPILDAAGQWSLLRHRGGDLHGKAEEAGIFMAFKGTIVNAMEKCIVPNPEKPGKTMLPMNLFIDGVKMPTDGGMLGWRFIKPKIKNPDFAFWTYPDLKDRSLLGHLLEHPLPFALTRIK